LRAKERDWHRLRKETGLKNDDYVDPVMLDVNDPSGVSSNPAIPSKVPALGDSTGCSKFQSMLQLERSVKGKAKLFSIGLKDCDTSLFLVFPKYRFLDIPPSNHLAWLLQWQRQDIMSSRFYLRRLTPRLNSCHPVLRHLPLPFRYVRP
jgi:hypothetical protein